jgi:hypothetical protein
VEKPTEVCGSSFGDGGVSSGVVDMTVGALSARREVGFWTKAAVGLTELSEIVVLAEPPAVLAPEAGPCSC